MIDKADLISRRFKEHHPDLLRLAAVIDIYETLDNKGDPSGIIKINVKHPFVFDIRTIPKKFEGIDVMDITMGDHPKEFPDGRASLPWYEMFAPEHYISFVDNNLQLIRKKLKQAEWAKEEILDALTGGLKQYVQKCKEGKETAMAQHKNEISFFRELLVETDVAFNKSRVMKDYGKKNKWNYSVMATSIFKKSAMVVGFNWGAAKDYAYEKQKEYPIRMFESNYNDLGSLKRTIPYFYKYYPEALRGMQSNFCFFRSEHESQVQKSDLDLCKPLFLKLIRYAQPSSIVTFSSSLRDYLIEEKVLKDFKIHEEISNGKKSMALKGILNFGAAAEIPVYYLPHPMARINAEERKKLWEFCFLK